jgi:tetratricopeptide (TPR) repeat protein
MKKQVFILAVILAACAPKETSVPSEEKNSPQPVLTSLLGKAFYEPEWTATQKLKLDSNVNVALKNLQREASEENYIWYGRRVAYRMELKKAIEIFTEGLEEFPDSYRLYRHRGHRYISLRQFDHAIADLEKAVVLMKDKPLEVEPDGQPNKLNIPLSSTQFNVWYHLALAYYLKGDFAKAEEAYKQCMQTSNNTDLFIATADWLYMTFRRQGKVKDAEELLSNITDGMTVIENDAYYQRLLMYQGKRTQDEVLNPDPESEDFELALATQGYGVGNWYLYNADTTKAREIFERVVEGKHFSSFGFIASEAELARWKLTK